jgi:hypothetical protein
MKEKERQKQAKNEKITAQKKVNKPTGGKSQKSSFHTMHDQERILEPRSTKEHTA